MCLVLFIIFLFKFGVDFRRAQLGGSSLPSPSLERHPGNLHCRDWQHSKQTSKSSLANYTIYNHLGPTRPYDWTRTFCNQKAKIQFATVLFVQLCAPTQPGLNNPHVPPRHFTYFAWNCSKFRKFHI